MTIHMLSDVTIFFFISRSIKDVSSAETSALNSRNKRLRRIDLVTLSKEIIKILPFGEGIPK